MVPRSPLYNPIKLILEFYYMANGLTFEMLKQPLGMTSIFIFSFVVK